MPGSSVLVGKKYALIGGTIIFLVVALTLHVELMFYMCVAMAVLPAVSWAFGRRTVRHLDLRVAPDQQGAVSAGQRVELRVRLQNTDRLQKTLFTATLDLPRDAFSFTGEPERLVPGLAPGETYGLSYELVPRRRGVYPLGAFELRAPDPIGLYESERHITVPGQLIVYPTPVPLPPIRPRGAGVATTAPRRRNRGQGIDIYGLREYVPGDDLRRVHWKNSARRGKLTVVEYEAAEAHDLAVVLDLTPSAHAGSGDESTLEYGVTLAASAAVQALSRGAGASLIAVGATDRSVLAQDALADRTTVLEALAWVQADGPESFAAVLADHAGWLPPGCGVVVISPAVGPEAIEVARRLRVLDHGVVWVCLLAHTFGRGAMGGAAPEEGDYAELAANLAALGCTVRYIRSGEPLAAQMGVRIVERV